MRAPLSPLIDDLRQSGGGELHCGELTASQPGGGLHQSQLFHYATTGSSMLR